MNRAQTMLAVRTSVLPSAGLEHQYRVIFDAVSDGIFIVDPATRRFIDVNQSGCQMFGYQKHELIGLDIRSVSSGIHPYTEQGAIETIERALASETQTFEWQCKTKQDRLFWVEISIRFAEVGSTVAMLSTVRDITERKKLTEQVEFLARYDALTGLANRPSFTTALDLAIAKCNRSGEAFAVLLLDLDQFKDINDTRGHAAGDRLLQLVAERLSAECRADESVFRLGGDEFAILLANSCGRANIGALADRLIASIGRPCVIDGLGAQIGVSIGSAIYQKDDCDADTLMTRADTALYRAKAEGRQIYRVYSEAMNKAARSRVALTDELRFAIPNGQLFVAYQPQVSGDNGRIVGVEALVRWNHPSRGILGPASFLPVAESSGLMVALDRWVLREACRQSRTWLDAGIAPSTMCVNLSSAHFKEPLELESFVRTVLEETGLPAHMLELEITEGTLVGFSAEHTEMMQRLRSAGVRFALDDFGTGYSSLNYLRLFSVDRIKIAQEFIADLSTSSDAVAIVRCILNLARALGNDVIAEGAETSDQVRLLREWDCPAMQGFYFARPMTAEALSPHLNAGAITPSGFH